MAQGCLKWPLGKGRPQIGTRGLDSTGARETIETGRAGVARRLLTDSMIDPRATIVKGYKPVIDDLQGPARRARGPRH